MAKRIAMFNHKGGVSKTTSTFNIGWMLADLGHKVIIVDADPQCNLTGLVLGYRGNDDFADFYERNPSQNIYAALKPAFDSEPKLVEPVECVPAPRHEQLLLLPGHIRLSEYEVTLSIAQELSESLRPLRNIPGATAHLIQKTAEHYGADFVLIDMNPSLGAMNQNLLMTSDYFILPSAPDYFSYMAIDSLTNVFPRWANWVDKAQSIEVLASATYPFPKGKPRFLGTIIQKYRPRGGVPTVGFQHWIDRMNSLVADSFLPLLEGLGMSLDSNKYAQLRPDYKDSLCLAQIADFNTLIATSQKHQVPVFAIEDEMFGHVGTVLEIDQGKREEFRTVFKTLAEEVVSLTT